MSFRILHIVDPSTPADAFDMLAQLLPRDGTHHIIALGHHSTKILADAANISEPLHWIPSLGWADPTSCAASGELSPNFAQRISTLGEPPGSSQPPFPDSQAGDSRPSSSRRAAVSCACCEFSIAAR